MAQQFAATDRPRAIVDTVTTLGEVTDLYVAAAPRARRGGGIDAIAQVWCLWADCDESKAVNALELFTPRPSIVVRTGSGTNCHAWWPLRQPLTPEQARRANRRLAQHLRADMRATDAARILRPIGTMNWKHEPPAAVQCVRLDLLVHDACDVVGHLDDPPRELKPSSGVPISADDPLKAIPAETYIAALTGRAPGGDGKIACPFHDDSTPSLHVYPGERGWVCFGCGIGGSVIDFGAALYGIEPRGRGFHAIRRRLAADLLGAKAAA